MKLHLWGTRGSLPRAITHQSFLELSDIYLKKAEKSGLSTLSQFREALHSGVLGQPLSYGGNTSCYEIMTDTQSLFVDMGSGLAEASAKIMVSGRTEHNIFLTHMHWDHILGLPFFMPIYAKDHRIKIYHVHPKAPEAVKILFNGVNFPLRWDQLAATIDFIPMKLHASIELGDVKVSSFALDHPGGSFGYRFDSEKMSIGIGVDGEYKRRSAKELGKDRVSYQELDLLVFDGQYEEHELESHYDWGHSSPPIGVDLALREGIRHLLIAHHDPKGTEDRALRMLEQARIHCRASLPPYAEAWKARGQPEGPRIHLAYDGLIFDLQNCPPSAGKPLDT